MAGEPKSPYYGAMKRREFLAAVAASTFLSSTIARAEDWQTRLIKSSATDKLLYGLHIKLSPGWKTYWRVPGSAGIPPSIKLEGTGIESLAVDYPLPIRINDESGEAIGYHDEVVFILRPKPKADAKPEKLDGKVSAFFGVCKDICRPAKFAADLSAAVVDDNLMQKYLERVPVASDFIRQAIQSDDQLELNLEQVVQDILVVGPEGLYFHKPTFGIGSAKLKIFGLTGDQKLRTKDLDITAIVDGTGLEQTVTVA